MPWLDCLVLCDLMQVSYPLCDSISSCIEEEGHLSLTDKED